MTEDRRPPALPEHLAVTWSERGAETGGNDLSASLGDRTIGALVLAAWRLAGLLALPFLLLHPGARRHILRLPAPEPGWTWLHGASAGEHVAARALARCLDRVWRTSSSWRTPVAGAFPAPLDLPFVVGPWLDRARPARLVLIEAELWPGWLAACRKRGIPVAVVNARRGRGTGRLRRLGPVWRWLTEGVAFVDQSETGDLKLAAEVRAAAFDLGRDTFIAGSTRSGDEARVLAGWLQLPSPRPLLVLAPRHLDRVPEVVALLQSSGARWARRTTGLDPEAEVLLLDTIGELGTLFQHARAAFVGGTFDEELGGHSPAEAFAAGLPVLHGPHTHANPVAWTQGITLRLSQTADAQSFAHAIRSAMAVGKRAPPANEAAARTAALLPDGHIPPETPLRPWLFPVVPVVHALARAPTAATRVDVPVISVGALVAGGAGKTPVAAWLAERLDGAWVVARGYRREGGGVDVRVGLPSEPPTAPLGDELEMLRRRGIPVVSAPDRVAGAREAARRGARLVLLDDGFQHLALHRDLDVVCIDGRWPDGRGPIPVGWRREAWAALGRAHWLWVNHPDQCPPLPGRLPRVDARYVPEGWLRHGELLPLDAVTGAVHTVAGIARPEGFVCQLLALGLELASLRTEADHAALGDIPAGTVLTEKDAARLPPDADVFALRLRLEVSGAEPLLAAIGEGLR